MEKSGDYTFAISLGLVFGALGDVFLLPKGSGAMFKAGLVSFLVGHLFYISAFLTEPVDSTWLVGALCIMAVRSYKIWSVLNTAASDAAMKGISVIAYILVITIMVTGAIGNIGYVYRGTGSFVGVYSSNPEIVYRYLGAEMFYFSDICVARERFVVSSPLNKFLGLPLYYGAQLILAYWI